MPSRIPKPARRRRSVIAGLQQQLTTLHGELAERLRADFQRDLPLNELLGDRWQRAQRAGFGAGSSVYDSCCIFGDVTVGEGTWIGPFTVLDGSGGLSIGRNCSISSGVMVYTHDTVRWALSGGTAEPERAAVSIGDCCYLGSQVVVAKGVTIGDHCVVGAGAFINRNLPPWSIAAGVPARIIGKVIIGADGGISLRYRRSTSKGHR